MRMIRTLCRYCESRFSTTRTDKAYCSDACREKDSMNRRRYGGLHFQVLKRDNFQCANCRETEQLHVHHKDEDVTHNTLENLVTLCQSCHKRIHHTGELNNHYKHITKEQIVRAIELTSNLEEATKVLGITRKTLMKKRKEYGLPELSTGRSGQENKSYKHLSVNEIDMAFELEGNWNSVAERLGVSPSFLRKRRRELGMEMDATKRNKLGSST